MRNRLLVKLWQRMLLITLLCGVGQSAFADDTKAEKAFQDQKYFEVSKSRDAIHFKLLLSACVSYNYWADANKLSEVKIILKDKHKGGTNTVCIAKYSGESNSSKYKFYSKVGYFVLTNYGNKIVPTGQEASGGTSGGDDWHYIEFDWYPTQEMMEKYTMQAILTINRRGNTWLAWREDTGSKTFDNYAEIDLSSEVPTVSLSAPQFMADKAQAAIGNVVSIGYSTNAQPKSYQASFLGSKVNTTTDKQKTFYLAASDHEVAGPSCTLEFIRNQPLKDAEYNIYKVKATVDAIPAYHRIHNFGIDKSESQSRLTWELHNVNDADFFKEDAFVVQCSRTPNFSEITETVELKYESGGSALDTKKNFTCQTTSKDGVKTQKFHCDLLDTNEDAITYYRIQRQSTESLGWTHPLVAFASTSKFISELCVSVATNSTEARNNLLDKGYKLLDYNLNHGIKGNYVYIGYKDSDNPLNAISRIAIKKGSAWSAGQNKTYTDNDYTMQAVPFTGIEGGNLNAGIEGADSLYLYYSRDKNIGEHQTVITRLMHSSAVDASTLPSGFCFVGDAITAQPAAVNLNSGCPDGTEIITLMCQMHEHVSDYYGKPVGDDIYMGHDCCGVYFKNALTDGEIHISNADELFAYADLVNKAEMFQINARLTADIVVNENVIVDGKLNPDQSKVNAFRKWEPVGKNAILYSGTFDGDGHTISGLYCVTSANAGLFSGLSNGSAVTNLILRDSYFNTEDGTCGGICGSISAPGDKKVSISRCFFDGVLESGYHTGGIVGLCQDGSISIDNCFSRGTIIAHSSVRNYGGLVGSVGLNSEMEARNSYSHVQFDIKATERPFIGGLVGSSNASKARFYRCFSLNNESQSGSMHTKLDTCRMYSEEELKAGAISYELNANQNPVVWAQILIEDDYPVFFDQLNHTQERATVYEVKGYKCTDKNESVHTGRYSNYWDEAAILVHDKQYHKAEQATCSKRGNLEYWSCRNTDCGLLFSNEECTTIIEKAPILEPTGEHDYDEYTETCVSCGKTRHDIETEALAIESVECDHEKGQSYDILGRRVTDSHKGIVIIKNADGNTHKILKK